MKKLWLLLLLTGCTGKDRWQHTAIRSGAQKHDSQRLIYKAENNFRNLEVEICRIDGLTIAYINVHAHSIPPYDSNPKKARITIDTKQQHITLIGDRLAGGQRLRLPPLASKHLIDALRAHPLLRITLDDRFTTEIDTRSFDKKFRKISSPLSPLIPNHPVGLAI
jgi:hypothetical protein